jgi:outer membrane translocation and assembly module TamA
VGQRIETTFTEFHWGTRFSVGVPLFDWLETGLTYSYEFTDVYDVDPGVDATASRDLIISALGIKLHFHVLDNRFDPKWGFDVDLLHEFGGRSFGGEVHYDRSILEASVYVTPFLGITLAVHGWASIVDPKSITEEIPLQRRIYRGGAYSVRSFNFDKLGPKSADGVPLGGEGCLQLNIELRIPIYGPVGIALFFDTASLRQNAAQWLDFVDFRHGLGVGLRLNSPVGPLRLDFGLNPDRRPDEDLWSLHFTVGHAF